MGATEYQVSELDHVEFYWENEQLDVDTVFRPGLDNPFSPTAFHDWEKGVSAENSILLHEKGHRKNSPETNHTSLWETTMTPCIAEKSSIWKKIGKCFSLFS